LLVYAGGFPCERNIIVSHCQAQGDDDAERLMQMCNEKMMLSWCVMSVVIDRESRLFEIRDAMSATIDRARNSKCARTVTGTQSEMNRSERSAQSLDTGTTFTVRSCTSECACALRMRDKLLCA
jgi:hypothetical protein